jgi:peptidyl-prolyl cis-trans isomerase D
MISWISNLVQKRSKAIFSVLLFIIIIAFVFTIGAGPGIVSSDKTNYQRDFYGIDLNSAPDVQRLQSATMVNRYINGMRQYDENQFQQQMLVRQVRLFLANELAIPEPTVDELKSFVKSKRSFQNENGQFDPDRFQGFVASLKGGSQINEAFVSQVLKEDYRLQELDALMSGPGLVPTEEVVATVAREKTNWSIEIAKIDYKDFNPTIEIADEAIAEYFASNQFRYEIPAQYTISFVEFNASNVKDPIEDPGEEALQNYFLTNRSKFADAEKNLTPEGEETTTLSPLEIYEQIKNDVYATYVQEQRTRQAVVIANDFTGTLFDQNIQFQSIEFKKILLKYGLKLKSLPPFSTKPETQMIGAVPSDLYQNAMHLDSERYYSDVIPDRDDTRFLVAFLESKEDPRILQLDEVRGQVVQDYQAEQKAAKFSEHGIALAAAIREKLNAGEAFELVAESNELLYEHPEPFTLAAKPETLSFQLLQSVESLKAGEITDMITIENTGYFVLVNEKTVPEITEDDPTYVNTLQGINNYSGFSRYQALISDMISKKMNNSI